MRLARISLPVLLDEELLQVSGGTGGLGLPSTAETLMKSYNSLNYPYIGSEFAKPVAKETLSAIAGGFAATRTPIGAAEAGLGGLAYSATNNAFNQDYSKWIKPLPQTSWADFRRLDNR